MSSQFIVGKLPLFPQTTGTFGGLTFMPHAAVVQDQSWLPPPSFTSATVGSTVQYGSFSGQISENYTLTLGDEPATTTTRESGGHDLTVVGSISPKFIKLNDSYGNVGDVITATDAGPRWAPDYYSTVYNLYNQPVIEIDNEFLVRVVDPRKGFTQYAGSNPTTSNEDYVSDQDLALVFAKGLPTDRLWRVRLHVWVYSWREFSSVFLDSYSASTSAFDVYGVLQPVGKHTCSDAEERDLYGGSSHLFEFFTYDGGNTWYWTRLTGYQECG